MMTLLEWIRWVHLIAAATWMGGLIVLFAVVTTLIKHNCDRAVLQAVARQFGRVSWTAMGIAIATGILQVMVMRMPWSYGRLHMKIGIVVTTVLVALTHQLTARQSSPRVRGMVQLVILLCSLGVFAVAVAL